MDASFKTRLFGGFDREDVVTYIEKTAAENQTQLETLRAEVETLRKQRDEAASENEALRGLTEEDAKLREENARLQAQLAQAQAEASALRSECEALRGPALEYQSLKEHIAEIEISAHRRTEEFRAKAMERLARPAAGLVRPAAQHLCAHERSAAGSAASGGAGRGERGLCGV